MKKILIVGMIAVAMNFMLPSCGSSNDYIAVVPNKVLDEFYDKYPSAEEVDWIMINNLFEASFDIDDQKVKATYTPDGKLVRVET